MNMVTLKMTTAVMAAGLMAACAGPHRMGGEGMGGGMGGMQMQMGADNTPGWAMMSADEREAHHRMMMGSKSSAECMANMEAHRAKMAERAKAMGKTMDMPGNDMCGQMMQHGMMK